jgi:hypothetical protein
MGLERASEECGRLDLHLNSNGWRQIQILKIKKVMMLHLYLFGIACGLFSSFKKKIRIYHFFSYFSVKILLLRQLNTAAGLFT